MSGITGLFKSGFSYNNGMTSKEEQSSNSSREVSVVAQQQINKQKDQQSSSQLTEISVVQFIENVPARAPEEEVPLTEFERAVNISNKYHDDTCEKWHKINQLFDLLKSHRDVTQDEVDKFGCFISISEERNEELKNKAIIAASGDPLKLLDSNRVLITYNRNLYNLIFDLNLEIIRAARTYS